MSSESFAGLGVLLVAPVIIPMAIAAAGIGVAGAAVYGGAKLAQSAYDEHKKKLAEQYGIEKDRYAALDAAVEEISKTRQALTERIRNRVIRDRESCTSVKTFGEITAEVIKGLDIDTIIENADEANRDHAESPDKPIDFSELFEGDIELSKQAMLSTNEYIEILKLRVAGLVAFTAEERGQQERLIQKCEKAKNSSLGLEDVKETLGVQIEVFCKKLMEGEAELRRKVLVDYMTICDLLGETPCEIPYEAMVYETEKMSMEYMTNKLQDSVFETLNDSLSEVGLTNLGIVNFNGEEGYLIVDNSEKECGMYLRKSDDNKSFLFTTVSSVEPSRVGIEDKKLISSSASRLCEKKKVLFEEILPSKGINVDMQYEYDPPAIEMIHKMPQYSEYVRSRGSDSEAHTESVKDVNRQVEDA